MSNAVRRRDKSLTCSKYLLAGKQYSRIIGAVAPGLEHGAVRCGAIASGGYRLQAAVSGCGGWGAWGGPA